MQFVYPPLTLGERWRAGRARGIFLGPVPTHDHFGLGPCFALRYPHQTIHTLSGPLSRGYGLTIHSGPLGGASLGEGQCGVEVGIVNTKVVRRANSPPLSAASCDPHGGPNLERYGPCVGHAKHAFVRRGGGG